MAGGITELNLNPGVKAEVKDDARIREENVQLAESYIGRLKLDLPQLDEVTVPEDLVLDLGKALEKIEQALLKRKVEIEGHI